MKRFSFALGAAAVVAVLAVPSGVMALPGQAKAAVCAWAKHTPKLAQVQCDQGSEGDIPYVSGTIVQPSWSDKLFFESRPGSTGAILREQISYIHFPNVGGVFFKQASSNGLTLVKAFYGAPVAGDFSSARHVASIRKQQIYQGKRFVYLVGSYARTDPSQFVNEQKTIENDFVLFPRAGVGAAQNYARAMTGSI